MCSKSVQMIPMLLLGGLSLCHRDLGQNLGQERVKGLEGVGESARGIPAHFHVMYRWKHAFVVEKEKWLGRGDMAVAILGDSRTNWISYELTLSSFECNCGWGTNRLEPQKCGRTSNIKATVVWKTQHGSWQKPETSVIRSIYIQIIALACFLNSWHTY